MENVVIVGSGPAGLTAAIYTARANLQPVVVDGIQPGGQLTQTTDIENYPGFVEPFDGTELVTNMRRQAERLGVRFLADEVTGCTLQTPLHRLQLALGGVCEARSVIIATGASARYLGLPAEQQLIGRGVSGCATCDGSFFRGQAVAVVGGGDTAMEDALYLSRLASHVTIIHRRAAFRASHIMSERALANPRISVIWDSVVEDIADVARGEVTSVKLRHLPTGTLSDLAVQGVFIAIGHTPNTGAFKGQLALDDEGYIVTDRTRTAVPGVFAAGDVQDRTYKQAVTAAGTGCMAALEAERYLGSLAS